ncbi:helix-turn-helix domain-containing protein [Vagococcus fluvialis]|uniref:helix-turn-helix domain-containing protein n=1 Tax=Vagococcus fluvialis TaxID=2738 RepID=UPI003D148134
MNYESLLDKREATQLKLLKELMLSNGKGTISLMAKKLKVSKVSLESYIEDLHDVLEAYNGDIKLIEEGANLSLSMTNTFSMTQVETDFYLNGIKYQILNYLFHHREFSPVFLSNELLISESTLFRKIKELNQVLKEFEISIWQGKLVGEESQIRYFYFQFYWYLTESKKDKLTNSETTYLGMIEKALGLNLSFESQKKVSLWMSITKKRVAVANQDYKKLAKKCQPYEKDELYLRVRETTLRMIGHYAIEIEEEEAMLQFTFLISMGILSETDFDEYALVRSRFTPTALLDTVILESLLMYYKPLIMPRKLEKHLYFLLAQIHPRLYFFKGDIEVYNQVNIWNIEEYLSGHSMRVITSHLLNIAQKQLNLVDDTENSLLAITKIKYLSVVVILDSVMNRDVTVGISLEMDSLFKEATTNMLMVQLSSINGVVCEPYQLDKTYDLILTNNQLVRWDTEYYVFSELGTKYDFKKIKETIRNIYTKKNNPKLNNSLL